MSLIDALPSPRINPNQEAEAVRHQDLPFKERISNAIAHQRERRRLYTDLKRHFDSAFQPVPPGIPAPVDLIVQTSAMNREWLIREANPDVYFMGGYSVTTNWLKVLEHFGLFPRTIGSLLELGCGSGRILRHFRNLPGTRIVGADVNQAMIDWCKAHIPGAEFYCNQLQPPLNFAQDQEFDVVLALSVFTHIPVEWQRQWLEEIYRLLRPGGIFLCTIHGKHHEKIALDKQQQVQLACDGSITLTSEDMQASLSTQVGGSRWDVFQTRSEVVRVFGSVFHLLDYVPGALDLLVLEKPGSFSRTGFGPYPGRTFRS